MMEDPKHPLNPFTRNKPGEWQAPEEPQINHIAALSGYQHGIVAGLKEALEIAEREAYCERCFNDLRIAITARISELEG
jgi:hypothetical protein